MNSFAAIILDATIKATALLAFCWLLTTLLRRRSAALRHTLQTSALCGVLLLPLLSSLLPAWRLFSLPQFPAAQSPQTTRSAPAAAAPAMAEAARPASVAVPVPMTRDHVSATSGSSTATRRAKAEAVLSKQPASSSLQSKPEGGMNWRVLITIAWACGFGMFLVRLVLGRLRLQRLADAAVPLTERTWQVHLEQVAAGLEIHSPVALLRSDDTDVPLVTGTRLPKVILSSDYAEWSPLRRDAILRHELAHIKRLDAVTQLIADIAGALYWFHPVVWLTARAARNERERACDDYVLAGGARPSEYAHELLEIASSLRRPEFAAALAMARRSQLEGRVLALLNPRLRRGSVSLKTAMAVSILTLAIVMPLAAIQSSAPPAQTSSPAMASAPAPHAEAAPHASAVAAEAPAVASIPATLREDAAPYVASTENVEAQSSVPAPPASGKPAPSQSTAAPASSPSPPSPQAAVTIDGCLANNHHQNMHIEDHDGNKSWIATWSGDDCSVDLRAIGEIRFNADATDLESISSGGVFEVNERRGAELRQIRVTTGSSGLQYVYKINGAEQPFDAQAKAWFARFLLTLERTTGFAADTRVPMLLKQGGPTAVLDEINNLQGDYVRGIYFRKLLDQPNLPSPVVVRIINQAGQQIKTDYEMARVLMEVSDQYQLADETSRSAFLTAANNLKTDYEHARVLLALLQRPNISKENVRMALDSAATIRTDYEKSRILVTLAGLKSFDENEIATYLKLVAAIHTDYEKSRSLIALMQSHSLSSASVSRILDSASTIATDYEKSRILGALVGMATFNENQINDYLKVVDSMNTEYERSSSLLKLMEHTRLSPAAVGKLLDATARIRTDYEKSRVLVTVAQKYALEGGLRDKYINTANSIAGEYERKRALSAVQKTASI